eukprot:351557-Chlamydomonas_euryale.AAC.29
MDGWCEGDAMRVRAARCQSMILRGIAKPIWRAVVTPVPACSYQICLSITQPSAGWPQQMAGVERVAEAGAKREYRVGETQSHSYGML